MNAHVQYLREYQLIKYLPENTYSVCCGSDWFKLPDKTSIWHPSAQPLFPPVRCSKPPAKTPHKWQNHNIVHVYHTQLIHTDTLKPVNVQGTVRRGDTLWLRETFSERCTTFSMLRNLRQRDTCHIRTLSLGFSLPPSHVHGCVLTACNLQSTPVRFNFNQHWNYTHVCM